MREPLHSAHSDDVKMPMRTATAPALLVGLAIAIFGWPAWATRCPPIMASGNIPNLPKYSTTTYLQLISPNGGEVYRVGDTITIKWKNCNFPKTKRVSISLIDSRNQSGDLPIVRKIPISSGSYRFTIPATIGAYGSEYTVGGQNVYTVFIDDGMDGGGSASVCSSNAPFTIDAQTGADIVTAPNQ